MPKPRILTRQEKKRIKQSKTLTNSEKTQNGEVLDASTKKKPKIDNKEIKETSSQTCITIKELINTKSNTNLNTSTYQLAKNYTNEYFLVPITTEANKENKPNTKNRIKRLIINNNNINETKTVNIKPVVQNKIQNKIKSYKGETIPEKIKRNNNYNNEVIKKSEQICNEKFHEIDIFTIFGKSIGDQLRSFPLNSAIQLQNKIQDLITEERLKL